MFFGVIVWCGVKIVAIEIFKPAQVIPISDIENIIGHDIEAEDRLMLTVDKVTTYSGIEQCVTGCSGFRSVCCIEPILVTVIFHLHFHKTMPDMKCLRIKIKAQFR